MQLLINIDKSPFLIIKKVNKHKQNEMTQNIDNISMTLKFGQDTTFNIIFREADLR